MKSGADGAMPIDVALEYVAALGRNEPSDVTRLVAADFVNEHTAELGSGCIGRDEYARRLPGFFAMFPNRHYTVEETALGRLVGRPDDDNQATTEVVVRYRFGADVEHTRIDIPGVMWISVRDGLVTRRLDCWDSLTFQRQTGTSTGVRQRADS